jgi:hypothetical protein
LAPPLLFVSFNQIGAGARVEESGTGIAQPMGHMISLQENAMATENKAQGERQDTPALAQYASRHERSDLENMGSHKKIRLRRYYVDVDDAVFE